MEDQVVAQVEQDGCEEEEEVSAGGRAPLVCRASRPSPHLTLHPQKQHHKSTPILVITCYV